MKKLILSLVMMMSLMSFTNKNEVKLNKEEIVSPECWDMADKAMTQFVGLPIDDENQHNLWAWFYDRCELLTDYDEFQFPN